MFRNGASPCRCRISLVYPTLAAIIYLAVPNQACFADYITYSEDKLERRKLVSFSATDQRAATLTGTVEPNGRPFVYFQAPSKAELPTFTAPSAFPANELSELHASSRDAQVSRYDAVSKSLASFDTMVITLQDGWGASEIDFQLQFTPEANGSVQLYAFDFAGNLITPVDGGNLFTVSYQNSESQSYRAVTTGGRLIRQVWIKATTSVGGLRAIDHIRQVGLDGLVQRLHYGSAYATPGLPSGIAYSASNIAPSALNGLGGANNSASSGGGTAGTPGGGNSQASVPPGRIPSTPTTGSSFSLPLSVEITTDAVQEAFVRERDLDLLDRLTLPTGAFVRERNTHPTTTPPTGPEAPGSLGLIDAGSSNGALGSHGNPGNHGSQGSTHQFIPEHNGNPQSNEPPGGTPWLPIDETSFTGPGLETSAVTANPEPSTLTMWLIAVGICGSRRIRKHLKSVA